MAMLAIGITGKAGPTYYPAAPSQFSAAIANQQAAQERQAEEKARQQILTLEQRNAQIRFENWMPKHPWRILGGKTNWAKGDDWVQFVGKVVEVQPNGVRLEGHYGSPGFVEYSSEVYYNDFFVEGFPFQMAEGDLVTERLALTAKESGTYTYPTTLGGSRTIHKLIYGIPCDAPAPSPAELAAQASIQKSKSDAKEKAKQDAAARVLKWNQDQADAGDPYGLMRMGERFRDGEGVETNLVKARRYFIRASALGNKQAEDDLKILP